MKEERKEVSSAHRVSRLHTTSNKNQQIYFMEYDRIKYQTLIRNGQVTCLLKSEIQPARQSVEDSFYGASLLTHLTNYYRQTSVEKLS